VNPSHARAAGKGRVQASIVWELHVGPLRVRCLPVADGFEVQLRGSKGWSKLSSGPLAWPLLHAIVKRPSIATLIRHREP